MSLVWAAAFLLMIQAPLAPADGNLLANGGFEQHLASWDGRKDGGMSKAVLEAAHDGKLGLRVEDDDDVKGSSLGSEQVPAGPGRKFELRFWGRIMSGRGAAAYLQFFDADGNQLNKMELNNTIRVLLRGGEWKEYSLSGTAPDGAATVRVWVHTHTETRVIADFDDFVLVEMK